MKSTKTLDLCLIALFTAVITVVSQFNIPLPGGVPMTLQTFIIPVAGIVLGSRRGFFSALSYVILGSIGVPVFTGLSGGLGSILGVTGGFIISFPFIALSAGLFYEMAVKLSGEREGTGKIIIYYALILSGILIGNILNYGIGVLWFMTMTHNTLGAALAACVIPFIPTTLLKNVLILILGPALRHTLYQARLIGTANAA
ncbi:biotin transporter BioY [Oribacterium sp. WCC10]|uniref:biotin transporter BioY n=1 Tax=Oribacterium sp. WCC10 TaxID=1855343 RepID=UPI0008F442C5|nr:biotin transporter BioY [Oribacterium sp. WCC10]SFG62199.1 biotin transport system substrate-specific component [Oribacterium sp. WCC10]